MPQEKLHIEKNSVQETLVIPLYGRKLCSERYPSLFADPDAERIIGMIDHDFSPFAKKSNSVAYAFGALEVACRTYDLCEEIKSYLALHPNATVVSLGCGLDTMIDRCDNGTCRGYNLDLPDVIDVRETLLPSSDRQRNLPCDLNDPSWMDQIDFDPSRGIVFVAAGVFYYFSENQVRSIIGDMSERFPGGVLAFDSANARAVKMMAKTWVKDAGVTSIENYFHVDDDGHAIATWAPGIESVSCRGYMQGYLTLPKEVGALNRTLAKVADGPLAKMQIIRVAFKA